MLVDYINIGPTPSDEDCAQVGSEDYAKRSRRECATFIALIRRTVGEEPEGASLRRKGFEHDYGTYHEVVCYYDPSSLEATVYACKCESDAPTEWDNEARRELGIDA